VSTSSRRRTRGARVRGGGESLEGQAEEAARRKPLPKRCRYTSAGRAAVMAERCWWSGSAIRDRSYATTPGWSTSAAVGSWHEVANVAERRSARRTSRSSWPTRPRDVPGGGVLRYPDCRGRPSTGSAMTAARPARSYSDCSAALPPRRLFGLPLQRLAATLGLELLGGRRRDDVDHEQLRIGDQRDAVGSPPDRELGAGHGASIESVRCSGSTWRRTRSRWCWTPG